MGKKPSGVRPTLNKGTKMVALTLKRATNSYKLKSGKVKAPRI